jgi:hypothetical protein
MSDPHVGFPRGAVNERAHRAALNAFDALTAVRFHGHAGAPLALCTGKTP